MTAQERVEGDIATQQSTRSKTRSYSPLQLLFLTRIERLLEAKNTCRYQLTGEKWLYEAVNHCIYSTLRDSIELGVGEEAKAILRREHQAN